MKFRDYIKSDKGQSIFEILIAMAIAALIVGSSVTAIMVSSRSGSATVASQKAYSIANETLNNTRSFAESSWADLYTQNKGDVYQYHLAVVSTSSTSTILGIATGTEAVSFTSSSTEENINYTSWFTIDNVLRNSSNWIAGSGISDPTTQKITAHVSWTASGGTKQIDLVTYVSRVRTRSITFDDWSGSSGVTTPVTRPTNDYYSITGVTITAGGDITY
ncbi:MAG: hypothetical protein UX31_C0013G0018 [Candidatus Nomurabacteria bacterium GW2011_GWA1_46_11]|uniref:Uncharacterized protein n=2 Tax=Parcubacteria group TaxID=1794811 RepID=A0A1G1YW70_9BACT|nr:MAG: hypothetical protein UX29_C0020G0007 [Parcubacteria group bacterium GW2011_GWA2_46_10]KKU21744.1 MAG: hypothetical protein UX31_C0013G0018 [Candidatus Nomurabacteria bacterium GW2011_GWA1_46_11]OGY56641.1 MAG: hypothetical protein A2119_00360 [Candidatus Colwellbacteria bacterium GWA2_46_10]